jgi:hypothetical protein
MPIDGGSMLELKVYCYGVLRYTTVGDWNKVQELRERGYYVEVNPYADGNTGSGPNGPERHSGLFKDDH